MFVAVVASILLAHVNIINYKFFYQNFRELCYDGKKIWPTSSKDRPVSQQGSDPSRQHGGLDFFWPSIL